MRGRGEVVSMIEQESVLRGGFASPQRPSVLNSPGSGLSARNLVYLAPLVTAAIAHAPLLAQLGRRLWVSEQYQCFPLVLLGAIALGWNRLASMPSSGPLPKTIPLLAAWTIDLLLLMTAIALNSPSVAGFSALTTGLTVAYGAVGARAVRALLPSFFYLLLVLPPPFGLEQVMLLRMQQAAAQAASVLLDSRGIFHTLDGVTITTEVRRYFVEEACSGVNSLISTLAVVLFILLWQRFSVLRIALVTSLSIGWVLWANALRVSATILLAERWNLPVLEGAGHSALGFVTFLLAIVLSLSSHAFVLFLVPAGGRSLSALLQRWKEMTPSPISDA
jgi:exosortase